MHVIKFSANKIYLLLAPQIHISGTHGWVGDLLAFGGGIWIPLNGIVCLPLGLQSFRGLPLLLIWRV